VTKYHRFNLTIVAFLILANLISVNSYAQDNNSREQLIFLGPFTFSSKIDLGMLIAAAAFASTIVYNIIQFRKTERNLRREMADRQKEMEQRAIEQRQLMDAQQRQIKTQQDQMQNQRDISEAGFWLSLRDQLTRYDDIESYFSPGGKWSHTGLGPETSEEWSKVESYMSMLSLLNAMILKGVISEKMFHRLYGPRISLIYHNKIVRREKLEKEGPRWREFLQLCRKRGLEHSSYSPWPPFLLMISIGSKTVSAADMAQNMAVKVYDSITDEEVYVSGAKVSATVLYPSGQRFQFEGVTDEEGHYGNSWVIEDRNKVPGKARITIKVSKENKASSELTETFQIETTGGDIRN
jgi:hypothetical protein